MVKQGYRIFIIWFMGPLLLAGCGQAVEPSPTPVALLVTPAGGERAAAATATLPALLPDTGQEEATGAAEGTTRPTAGGEAAGATAQPAATGPTQGTEPAAGEGGGAAPTGETAGMAEAGPAEPTEAQGTAEPAGTNGGSPVEPTEETDKPAESTPESAPTEATEPATPLSEAELVNQGAQLFAEYCAACHQGNGQGIEGAYPPLAGNPFVATEDPRPAIEVVLTGRGGMPNFQDALSDQDIGAILSYVRTSWSNNAAPVNAAQVQEVYRSVSSAADGSDKEH